MPPDSFATSAEPNICVVAAPGTDTGRGNLLGIQPCMEPRDYATAESFRAKLDSYLAEAWRQGWLGGRAIVVLPEYLGSWLVVAGAHPSVYAAARVEDAMRRLIRDDLPGFARAALATWGRRRSEHAPWPGAFDWVKDALFRMRAPQMASIYHSVFSGLARDYGVTIVAGSLLLPAPTVKDGALKPGSGPLQNVSVLYHPDGRADSRLARKLFLITDEQPFTAPGTLADLPIFDTPAGRLGVVICADSWYPQVYKALEQHGMDFVAVPSYLAPDGVWQRPWQGYNGASPPADVDPADVGTLAEGEAWRKYALAGRIGASGARCGVNVFLRGSLWDLGADGASLAVRDGEVTEVPYTARGAIVNLWLP
ncbi:MAG TPA: nitrilase-related carbon-nitrogen hydrolase [Ardenticatenaceae bacterium]|jgi:hypothetical protein